MVDAEQLLQGLDEQQRRAASAVDGPVLILAGAGSGKTRTITHRIAYAAAVGAQRPERGLAVTFTAKAAGQMRSRLADLGVAGVAVMTFHAAALRQLRHFWPTAVGGIAPQLVPAKAGYLAEAAGSLGLPRDRTLIRDLASEIEWAKVSRVARDDYAARATAAGRQPPGGLTQAQVAAVHRAYSELLASRGLIDFEDVLVLTTALLNDRPDLGDQVRQRYRWITVDEYQDVSPIQHALLRVWLGDSDQVCVVGDPGQTIYTFAGASASYLASFRREHPQAVTVALEQSYRSSPQIIAAANRLLAPSRRSAALPPLRLTSQQPAGAPPRIHACADDIAEAEAAAEQVLRWRDAGIPLRQIAVLVRINAATAPIEDALAEAGIGYVVTGGQRFFSRPEIREAVVRLRGAANSEASSGRLPEDVAEVLVAMGFLGAAPPTGRGAARERWESLAAVSALAHDLAAADGAATLADLVAELDRRSALEAEPVADGVVVTTLHAAKGLEWDAVWIAGLQDGTVPISYADTDEHIEEERRLCYVGMTRARRELVLSWSAARSGERGIRRRPSRFLGDIADGTQDAGAWLAVGGSEAPSPRPPSGRRKRGVALGRCRICGKGLPTPAERAVRRCRTCPEDLDAELLQQLLSWRAQQVAPTGAPAYTVFTDLTLRAIAELRPRSIVDLRTISGVGPAKAERYGDSLVAMVARAAPDDTPAAGRS